MRDDLAEAAVKLPTLLQRSLSARMVVGLVVAFLAAMLFLEITREVVKGHTNAVDQTVSLWVHGFDSPFLDRVMRAFTVIGAYRTIIPVTLVVMLWARHRRSYTMALILMAVVSAAIALNGSLKLLFQRERPGLFFEVDLPATFSFPSGHSMVSLAAYGTMAVVIARLQPGLRIPLYLVTPLVVFFIGISRVYLGVHWPTDVAAGFAAGFLILLAGRFAIGRVSLPQGH